MLVDGAVDLFRTVGSEETRVGRMDAPGRWAGGFRAWDESGVYLASGRGVEFGRLLQVPAEDLRGLMERWLPLSVHLIRGVFGTARSIESTVRQRESLVTLGTLAAGLAHELNNPAAAAVRTVDAMSETCDSLLSSLGGLARGAISAEQFLRLDELRLEVTGRPPARRGMALSDAEDELVDWLDDHGMPEAYDLASTLAAASVDAEWCDRAADLLEGPALRPGLEWIAGTLAMGTLLGELREATGRVSELVGAVRSYTQMDRATHPARRRRRGSREHAGDAAPQDRRGGRGGARLRRRPAARRGPRRRAQPGVDEPDRQRRRRDGGHRAGCG